MPFELPVPSFSHLDAVDLRTAGRELLSLALMDARNQTLHLCAVYEAALSDPALRVACTPELEWPLWVLGHIGWFQERWVGRNLQRHQGPHCDPHAAPLASVLAQADLWWDGRQIAPADRWAQALPALADIKSYLLSTLEAALDLLAKTPDEDDALYFYRLALFHEDRWGETLITMAQTLGLPLTLSLPSTGVAREPLWVPATRWRLGLDRGQGFTWDHERPAHDVQVPDFEIDAQPVSWAQYLEFVADGGYDRAEFWQPAGWDWLQALVLREGRRAPRHVEQLGVARAGGQGSVLQTLFGRTQRRAGQQPALHVSWWEADAWCRWAGRRLPTEVEWELAAHTTARRGWRWGEVWEWTASTLFAYPGFVADPGQTDASAGFGSHKVLRGASFATRARLRSLKYRHSSLPGRDDGFFGFRSCAL